MNGHYKIGIWGLTLAIAAGISGGLTALFFQANQFFHFLSPDAGWAGLILEMVQAHARMMIFFTLQPALMIVFGAWFVPVLIGAKEFSFPRINVISLMFLSAGFLFNMLTFFIHAGHLFTLSSLVCWSIASILFSINMIVTILNNRAAHVRFLSMPVFVWMQGISAALLLAAASVLLAILSKDYWNYTSQLGWALQRTVQNFSYPMMMILILPAFGILFHIIQTISIASFRDSRGFFYWVSGIALCLFLFWNKALVNKDFWNLHSFASVQGIFALGLYMLVLSLVVCCLRQFIYGKKSLQTPVLWVLGAFFLFGIGWPMMGLVQTMGQIHSSITYAVLFSVFAGFYFWMGKLFGRQYSEMLGKIHFAIMFLGVCMTLNLVNIGRNTLLSGDILMGLSVLVFVIMLGQAFYRKVKPIANNWGKGAVTSEWHISSPMLVSVKQES